ncbi:MAG: glycoside hydrolase family 38 C-terminal domain-containing protein [Acidobacteriota bacterium]|nr:glycoside hydrolase family 38 C-terminal domain-containing protein [Acidobacteriota bacterium]
MTATGRTSGGRGPGRPDTLFFKTETPGHPLGYSYVTITNDAYVIREGDCLEYEIYIDTASPLSQAGVDIHFASGRALRESMVSDQDGLSSHPLTNLYDARAAWHRRFIDLSALNGEVTAGVEIAVVAPATGVYIACFRNIRITRDGRTVHAFYEGGEPKTTSSWIRLAFEKDVVEAIRWEDFRKIKVRHVGPEGLSPEIRLAEAMVGLEAGRERSLRPLIDEAKSVLDVEAYARGDEAAFRASLDRVGRILEPILAEARTFAVHLVGHAHLDMNWLWTWDETRAVCLRDAASMIRLLDAHPDFRFSQSQAAVYKAIENNRPDLFERIRGHAARGAWEVTASMWVEADENMASGEALVRQFLLADRFIRRRFGRGPVVCWQPDLFGHAWTMPQILRGCGVRYYYFTRCGKQNPHVFQWEGPDGSRVLAAATPGYNLSVGGDILTSAFELYKSQGIKDYMHVYGVGDHGGGPTERDIARTRELAAAPVLPDFRFATAESYFAAVEAKSHELPVVRDELQFIFEGCYTTHADIKLRNRQCENLFPTLETFAALALPYESPYPGSVLDAGWERTCFNQFHDILPGSAIRAAYDEALPITDGVLAAGRSALRKSLEVLAGHVDARDIRGELIAVFNPCSWERSDIATVVLPLAENEWPEIRDGRGRVIPSQVTSRSAEEAEVIFLAEGVPSLGYASFGWRPCSGPHPGDGALSVSGDLVVNEHLVVRVDPETGALRGLALKSDGREFVMPGGAANVLQLLHEKGTEMSAWTIGEILSTEELLTPESFEIEERGPVRIRLKAVHRRRDSVFVQRTEICRGLRRVAFPCRVDWREAGSRETGSFFLKAAFPWDFNSDAEAVFEIPFGTIRRPTDGREVPSQTWMDLGDGRYGVSLVNDSKYGCDIRGNVMRLSLLRSSYDPDPLPDFGRHVFSYAAVPYAGTWKTARTLREAAAFNRPLPAVAVSKPQNAGSWPAARSFLRVSADNIVVSAFKKAEEGDDLILRCHETDGRETEVAFAFPFRLNDVRETDLLERDIGGSGIRRDEDGFSARVPPYGIRTFRLTREPHRWPKRHAFQAIDPSKKDWEP